jgi:hypothetical protein
MLTRNAIATLILGLTAGLPKSAQEVGYRSTAAVQYFGSFHSGYSSNSGGVLATYRFYLTVITALRRTTATREIPSTMPSVATDPVCL